MSKVLNFIGILFDGNLVKKILVVFLAITIIVITAAVIVVTIPFIFLRGLSTTNTDIYEQSKLQEVYFDSVAYVAEKNEDYINTITESVSHDRLVLNEELIFEYYELIAVDMVRYEQNYRKINKRNIFDLTEYFVSRSYSTKKNKYKIRHEDAKGKVTYETITEIVLTINIDSVDLVTVCRKLHFSDTDINIAQNMYRYLLNTYSNTISDYIDYASLEVYPPGESNIMYFSQIDRRWGRHMYGPYMTIAEGGCGPTCLAMLVSSLTDLNVNPDDMSDWAAAKGYCAGDQGSYWSLMDLGAKEWHLNPSNICRDVDQLLKSLSAGKAAIALMGAGHFTTGGHFIVLRGISPNRKIFINDPYSISNTNKEWDIDIIIREAKNFWIYN